MREDPYINLVYFTIQSELRVDGSFGALEKV